MNVLGVIAEFNPIHNGHRYLLKKARTECRADYTIVVMSGNFTQRGEPAIYDKFIRTRLALDCGADLVLEITTVAATSSARDFARTGVALLASSGVVSHLAFGCENADLALLYKLSAILSEEPGAYKKAFKEALKSGFSWPAARSQALLKLIEPENESLSEFLKQPNNILALEYLMALNSPDIPGISGITPVPVERIHSGYHDKSLDTPVCSATALRCAILGGQSRQDYIVQFPKEIRGNIRHILDTHVPMAADDFSHAMIGRLLSLPEERLTDYLDIDEYLSHRIHHQKGQFTGFSSFCELVRTRAYTRTRISRALLHTLLDIKKSDQAALAKTCYAPYLRILGFRKETAPLLSHIKKKALAPIITRPALVQKSLQTALEPEQQKLLATDLAAKMQPQKGSFTQAAARLFSLDVYAADIYRSMHNIKSGQAGVHEFQQKIVII